MGQEEAVPMTAAVVFTWEPTKTTTTATEARDMAPESPRKARALARRLSVPPPPGRPLSAPATRSFSRARAVRPEDDPFLAAYLACTKSSGRRSGGGKDGGAGSREAKQQGRRRFTWAGLGLSCKGSGGAVEQSMVKLAKRLELDPRDA